MVHLDGLHERRAVAVADFEFSDHACAARGVQEIGRGEFGLDRHNDFAGESRAGVADADAVAGQLERNAHECVAADRKAAEVVVLISPSTGRLPDRRNVRLPGKVHDRHLALGRTGLRISVEAHMEMSAMSVREFSNAAQDIDAVLGVAVRECAPREFSRDDGGDAAVHVLPHRRMGVEAFFEGRIAGIPFPGACLWHFALELAVGLDDRPALVLADAAVQRIGIGERDLSGFVDGADIALEIRILADVMTVETTVPGKCVEALHELIRQPLECGGFVLPVRGPKHRGKVSAGSGQAGDVAMHDAERGLFVVNEVLAA